MESDANRNYQNDCSLLRSRPGSLISANGSEKGDTLVQRYGSDGGNSGSTQGVCRFAAVNLQLPAGYPLLQNGGLLRSPGADGCETTGKVGPSFLRQNISPPILFPQYGYNGVKAFGDSSASSSKFNNPASFTSFESRHLTRPDVGNPGYRSSSIDLFSGARIPFGSWKDSSHFASCRIKTEPDHDPARIVMISKKEESSNRQQHSYLKASPEVVQDRTVTCKLRAKRGCATHPRSIAERVRRTRISERMRKLQELVPNMDKQTNTADMLDLALDYVKHLQKQYKTLSDNQANCKCSAASSSVRDTVL